MRTLITALLLLPPLLVQAAPDAIWIGEIITLDESRPRAEAVAVTDGEISAVGDAETVLAGAGADTRIHRLGDDVLVPGFIDAHGHVYMTGMAGLLAPLAPPPDGAVQSIDELVAALRAWREGDERVEDRLGWVFGMGYDDAMLAEGRHPDRHDLDTVAMDVPVLVIHQSGHLGVTNSAGLAALGIDRTTPDPAGGVIRRDADGEPNGILEENALFVGVYGAVTGFTHEDEEAMALRGLEIYARNGFTTAQDGRANPVAVGAFARLAERDGLPIDVVSYPDIAASGAAITPTWHGPDYRGGFRIGGAKLSLDGSPQGKTAWLTAPYHVPPAGRGPDYVGYPSMDDERVLGYVEQAFESGWQLLVHCNGDAAADQFIGAVRAATARLGQADRRPVMIHAQTVREDQLDAMAELGIVPAFFPSHTYYWGDWHRESVLGPERADRISPTQSALARGMYFTAHHDAPVTAPDALRIMWATVNRRTRSGDILGPSQRVDAETALKATTLWAARQIFEEDRKGSIEVGKLADFTLLSADPLAVAPQAIIDLRVRGTVKAGHWVYRAADAAVASMP